MNSRFLAISALVIVLASPCWADTFDIPLPELHGLYSMSGIEDRSASFQIPGNVIAIHGAWIVLSGSVNAGVQVCDFGIMDTTSVPYHFLTLLPDTSSGQTYGCEPETPDVTGTFDLVVEVEAIFGATGNLDFLLSGHGVVQCLGGPPIILGSCWLTVVPDATMENAVLRIDAEFASSNESSTWGAIKALYR